MESGGGKLMEKRFRRWDPGQALLLPSSVEDFVPPGHPARLIRDLVCEELELSAVLSAYEERRGQPPYHPVMMTALLMYAYSAGVFSSRKIARACLERVDFMAVTALEKPDFRTVSAFRKRHLNALEGLFVQVLRLCRRAGLVKLVHVALDGTRIQANASKHKAMSYERMCSEEERLAREVADWMRRAEEIDAEEDERFGPDSSGDEVPDWMKSKEKRLAKIREAKEALEREAKEERRKKLKGEAKTKSGEKKQEMRATGKPPAKAQRNFTDPDSRILRDRNGFVQGYNCQAAVDSTAQVVVSLGVSAAQLDAPQMLPLVDQLRRNLNGQAREVSADAGYCTEDNIKGLSRRRIRAYIATGRHKHGDKGPSAMRNWRGPWTSAMATRLARAGRRTRYRLRKLVVEPVFGQIKECLGFRRFLLRGIENVRSEWSLVCTAHNLRKLLFAR
jgi:transposase